VVVIPTNRVVIRDDKNDRIYKTAREKYAAVIEEIVNMREQGRPTLVGTTSVEISEFLSRMLSMRKIPHNVLNAKLHQREAEIVAKAGQTGTVTIATNMAGRGTDIKLGGNPEHRARKRAGTEASPERYAEVYRDEYEKWKADYEEVKRLGGLYVIGTERHESRRIDNQLRGRSGRQGDPGRSKFFISMDDDLMRLFGGDNIKSLMTKIGMTPGEPIYHPWLNKSIERAQKKVEERNFEIRKHLLEYDDVLNQQRKFIYEQRDAILSDANLVQRVNDATRDMVVAALDAFRNTQRRDPSAALKALLELLKTKFGYTPSIENAGKEQNTDLLEQRFVADLEKDIADKVALVGEANLNLFIRMQYLQAVDRKWLDHLENMEALREAVYLRSYAQKNPLTEYKVEGFQIFDKMIDQIREEIASRLHLVRIQLAEDREREAALRARSLATTQAASHGSVGAFAGAGKQGATTAASRSQQPENATVVRSMPKVGRNDPCPCGSGKKYKYCHGR
jgi:preprotein translocase subunit SecA